MGEWPSVGLERNGCVNMRGLPRRTARRSDVLESEQAAQVARLDSQFRSDDKDTSNVI